MNVCSGTPIDEVTALFGVLFLIFIVALLTLSFFFSGVSVKIAEVIFCFLQVLVVCEVGPTLEMDEVLVICCGLCSRMK